MNKLILAVLLWTVGAGANTANTDLLIELNDSAAVADFKVMAQTGGAKVQSVGVGNWIHVQLTKKQAERFTIEQIKANPAVVHVQPNYKISLRHNYRVEDQALRAKIAAAKHAYENGWPFEEGNPFEGLPGFGGGTAADNPDFPTRGVGGSGADPEYSKQWGMNDNKVRESWRTTRGQSIIVAVIDTGVDYTHEDLVDNMWRNPGESGTDSQGRDKSTNGVDDDSNGYIDDLMGWDVVAKDNKPFDLAVSPFELLLGGGNPGHGTHCAGNVAAVADNGKGVAGVAPGAKIMALRFLSEKGQGDTVGAVEAINYAVKMGAKVMSNSWGSEGEDPNDAANNKLLRDAIAAAQAKGVLFIAAAGNGHQGVGYDNDSDKAPAMPASYDHDIIVSVAALDDKDALGSFSNWGARTVDIGAPGVKVFSTTVGSTYSDTVFDMFGMTVTWDGTSMATPHVAGAAALYWAAHPNATWQEVKAALLNSSKKISALSGKSVSGGKLSVEQLMQ